MNEAKSALVVAHRGFRGIVPENTLLAAEKGLAAGTDMWELDVAASRDGVLVVLHDDTLVRTTDAKARFPTRSPWTVYDFDLAELKTLDSGSWYAKADPFGQIKAGKVGPKELETFVGLRIPTLEEALDFTKRSGWKVNVEIKDATGMACDPWIVEKTVELIARFGMAETTLVSSFNHDYLRRVRKADPRIELGALVEEAPADPVALLKELGARSYNPGLKKLEKSTVEAVRAAGFDVFIWTVNEEKDMRRVLEWGATGLFTDFPDRFLRVLGR